MGIKMVENQNEKVFLDELSRRTPRERFFDFPLSRYVKKYKNTAIILSKQRANGEFHVEGSSPYCESKMKSQIKRKKRNIQSVMRVDSVVSRNIEKTKIHSIGKSDIALLRVKRKCSDFRERCLDAFDGKVKTISPVKMWNFSLVGAIILGMFTMTMIYHYLGGSVSAKIQEDKEVALAEVRKEPPVEIINDDIDISYITNLLKDYKENEELGFRREEMREDIMAMVEGYPIEVMVPEIIKRDRMIAALLIAIGRKESAWGKRVPVLNGEDCFNYWGYRGIRKRMGTGGHTCFDSPKDAVDTVAKRIETLVNRDGYNTPAKMVVWKCGYDCSWDSKTAIQKWISDVDYYYQKLKE